MPTIVLTHKYSPTDSTTIYSLKTLLEALAVPVIGRLASLRLVMNPHSPTGSVWIENRPQTISGNPAPDSLAVAQVETATVVGTIGVAGAGNATVVVTGALVTGTPLTVPVAVANNDTAALVAGKIRTALNLLPAITTNYVVSGATDKVILTAKVAAANDATLNISTDNGTCTGLTAAPTSANTTAGSTAGTYGVDLSAITGGIAMGGNGLGNTVLPENILLAGEDDNMLVDILYSQL